ncbi:MAG: tetratricopeptide repeat protein [Chitinophagaceae bacterium]|nr:tetratricopeptide repeat protein [Chitinophagaceae bacterium]
MNNRIELIENYLGGNLPPEESILFEKELLADEELNSLFNMYRTIDTDMKNAEKYKDQEQALKNTLQQLNAKYFKAEAPVVQMRKKNDFIRVAMAAAAGLVLIIAAYFAFFQSSNNPTQLADKYVQREFTHLSLTMDGVQDSLQMGMAAYNDKDYQKALQIFEGLYKNHPDDNYVLKYKGLAYLLTKNYDKALSGFDELAAKKHLFSNDGLFLKAITLLQRNQAADKDAAKQILEQVVAEKAEGNAMAEDWLKKWK